MGLGEGREGQQVLFGVGEHGGNVSELIVQGGHDPLELLAHRRASGWAKIVWMAAITMWVLFRFTRVSTLRMKWTRHRCQADPTISASTAAFRPRCWSEMTSRIPPSPRARNERRNSVQKAPSSESPTAQPRTSQWPSIDTPVATTTARETRPGGSPGPSGRWRPGTRRGTRCG